MRYRLRTLLIVLALGPPVIWAGWLVCCEYVARHRGQGELIIVPDGGAVLIRNNAP
jgi:hypothetical protein